MRVFGKAATDNAPRDPPSVDIQPTPVDIEKPHGDENDTVKEKTSGLNASDSAVAQTISSGGWAEPTAVTSTVGQDDGWGAWASNVAGSNISRVNAGW